MKVIIDLEERILNPVIVYHLATGYAVQDYIRAALAYYNHMMKLENSGKKCGFGDAERFSKYNEEVSPMGFLGLNLE